LYKKIYPFW